MRQTVLIFATLLSLASFALRLAAAKGPPDPTCSRGIQGSRGACCPKQCKSCGGQDCGSRSRAIGTLCCLGAILSKAPSCLKVGAPCVQKSDPPTRRTSPAPPVPPSPPQAVPRTGGVWRLENRLAGLPERRHEHCFAFVGGRGYLIGGRDKKGVRKSVDIFDPIKRTWTKGRKPPQSMHHFQCQVVGPNVWVVSSWRNSFPLEVENENIYIYHTVKDTWSIRNGLPANRRRGGAASVKVDRRIFVIGGNRGGHGLQGRSLPWVDYYDLNQGKWFTGLPNLPDARDHTGAAVVRVFNGSKLVCVASGRDSSSRSFYAKDVRAKTYCFDASVPPRRLRWVDMRADLPVARAGSGVATLCDGRMAVAGGAERDAHSETHIFNGVRWKQSGSMGVKRHGAGLAVSKCSTCGKAFIASGARTRGGKYEVTTTEVFWPNSRDILCKSY